MEKVKKSGERGSLRGTRGTRSTSSSGRRVSFGLSSLDREADLSKDLKRRQELLGEYRRPVRSNRAAFRRSQETCDSAERVAAVLPLRALSTPSVSRNAASCHCSAPEARRHAASGATLEKSSGGVSLPRGRTSGKGRVFVQLQTSTFLLPLSYSLSFDSFSG